VSLIMNSENNSTKLKGKASRLLYFMSELEKGNQVNKDEYLNRYQIVERTLKEDLKELKENLAELRPNMQIKYSRKGGYYEAHYDQGYGNLKYNQAVILSKILLESRALRKEEVNDIIQTFVDRAVDDRERDRILNLTKLELDHYKELSIYQEDGKKSILTHLSRIFNAIENKKPLSFNYIGQKNKEQSYQVLPVSIIFNDHYFYCIAYKLLEENGSYIIDKKNLRHFRLDRFKTVHRENDELNIEFSKSELEGLMTDSEVRYHTFSMFSNTEKYRIRFRYIGGYANVLEDDIPALKVVSRTSKGDIETIEYELTTYGREGFQHYIERFNGKFTILEIEKL